MILDTLNINKINEILARSTARTIVDSMPSYKKRPPVTEHSRARPPKAATTGTSRAATRRIAILELLSHKPLPAHLVFKTLDLARSSVEQDLRALVKLGLLEKVIPDTTASKAFVKPLAVFRVVA